MRRAVIDVGSNSVLLLVAEQQNDRWVPIFESTDVTSLGGGTKKTGLLSEAGQADTLAAIARDFEKARSLGATQIVAAATMAARIATNTDAFLARAQAQGTPVSVLSGDDEARLGLQSVTGDPTFAEHSLLTVIDIGGQSTELATAQRTESDWETKFRRSFPLGTLGLRGEMTNGQTPDASDQLAAVVRIDDLLAPGYKRGEAGYAVVLGATGTNLVSLRDRMATWDAAKVHGTWLDFDDVGQWVARLMVMTDSGRAALVGMEPGREKTLHLGALILERILCAIGVTGCAVSVRGWRHALLESLGP